MDSGVIRPIQMAEDECVISVIVVMCVGNLRPLIDVIIIIVVIAVAEGGGSEVNSSIENVYIYVKDTVADPVF